MADRLEDAEFWLPSNFLCEDDLIMENKENLNKNGQKISNTGFCFPTEFHYYFDSVVNSSDEEDQLAELTRQLTLQNSNKHPTHQQNFEQKSRWVMAGSPQSTLSQLERWSGRSPASSKGGSPNGPSQVSSPPTTPFVANNDAWDLIYQAANEVARLKLNAADAALAKTRNLQDPQLHSKPSIGCPSALYNTYVQQAREELMAKQQKNCGVWSNKQVKGGWSCDRPQPVAQNRGVRVGGFAEIPSLEFVQRQNQPTNGMGLRSMFLGCASGHVGGASGRVGGAALKKPCAGTGVFLPRSYGSNPNDKNAGRNNNNIPAEPRKRPGCSSASVPPRVQALNKNFNNNDRRLVYQPVSHPHFNNTSISEYEALVARRNALLMQQRRSIQQEVAMTHDISLPQEWTY